MKHPLSTLDTFSFRRHEGFTKQDGNTRFCSSNELETEKRNSRCWRSRSFEWSPPKLRTWAGWGYVFFSCQMSKGSFMHSLCLNLNPSPDLQTDSLAFSGFPQANSHILENGRVPSKFRSVMFSCWLGARGHNAHALGHMGATRRGTYAATEPATAATGSEAPQLARRPRQRGSRRSLGGTNALEKRSRANRSRQG